LKNIAVCTASLGMALLILASLAASQSLSGTVTNGTTSKPAVGDEVILINLTNGMEIAANTKVDSKGKFSFKLTGAAGPHLIRAVHGGVTYHQMAPPGVDSVDVQVYDVVPKVTGLSVTADVIRFQADTGTLQGVRLFVVSNTSSPAKTQMNDHNFEFYLPAGAKVEQAQATAPNGQPISTEVAPQAQKDRYAFVFPLRPGETQFQVEFTVPYAGEIKIDPKLLYPSEHFVVVVPKTMQFEAENRPSFEAMEDPSQGDGKVEVAKETKPGQPLGFTLKGNGVINESPGDTAPGAGQQSAQNIDNRPGGGLGVPIDAPDALQKYRWPILGGFALLLAVGGWLVTKRQPSSSMGAMSVDAMSSGRTTASNEPAAAPRLNVITPPIASLIKNPMPKELILLEALKEEMFQLEVEKKQGKITAADYEKTRAALDHTLGRALNRSG
jgi:hypothetical protein